MARHLTGVAQRTARLAIPEKGGDVIGARDNTDGDTNMKRVFGKQAKRAGIALAVVGAFAALGIGTALAAPTFASATLSIEQRGEAAGGLTCTWRETGLGSSQVVYYTCGAAAVGALKACVFKNRIIFASPTQLDVFKNVTGEHGGAVPFLSQKNGQLNASTTTPIPEIEVAEGAELCIEPTVETVVAVRWCNASLVDTTNGVTGPFATELSQAFFSGVGEVPPCTQLLGP